MTVSLIQKRLDTACGALCYWRGETLLPARETLVFLPGLTADHRLFDRQIAYFASSYNVLTWDAPGHGASRPFQLAFSLMDKAAWLHAILQAEGIAHPVLIGQSMGGYVAQCYMQRYPNSVRAFVSIDSAPLKRRYMTAAEIWLLKHTDMIYYPYPWRALLASGAKGCAETAYGRQLMREMMESYSKREYCRLTCHGYRILAEAIEADLPYTIDCPALLLCGECDKAGSTKRYNLRWAGEERLPLVMIPAAGHNSNTDRPTEVNAAIEDFLRRV